MKRLTRWLLGRRPVVTAFVSAGLAIAATMGLPIDTPEIEGAVVTLILAVAALFTQSAVVSPVTFEEKIVEAAKAPVKAAPQVVGSILDRLGGIAGAVLGREGRPEAADPLDTVAGDSRINEGGGVPLAMIIALVVVFLVLGGAFATCDALWEDPDEENDLGQQGRVELVSHEYGGCDPYYEDCRGGSDYGSDYSSDDRNRNRGRNRGAFSPGPFDRSPIDMRNACISLDCSNRPPAEEDQPREEPQR